MSSHPVISVCIANYNGMEIIDNCLRSIREQTLGLPIEIIVHDDASTDGSAAHLRACHPDVTLITSTENVGYCVSNNRMVAAAGGKYLLLLNNDAALFHDALATLYHYAESLPRQAILGLPQFDWDTGELVDMGSRLDPFLNSVPNHDRERNQVGMVAGACLWIPKALWLELGGFPEWFGSIAEDLYLCCQARLAGYPVMALGTSGFRHRIGRSFGGGRVTDNRLVTNARRRALSERNKTFTMIVTLPPAALYPLLPIHLVVLLLEGMVLASIKLDWRVWSCIYQPLLPNLWRHRKTLWVQRRAAQQHRNLSLREWFCVFEPWPYKLKMLFRHGLPEIR